MRFRNFRCSSLIALILGLFASSVQAHEISFSHGKVQLGDPIQISLELPVRDLARALGSSQQILQRSDAMLELRLQIERLVVERFRVSSAASVLTH